MKPVVFFLAFLSLSYITIAQSDSVSITNIHGDAVKIGIQSIKLQEGFLSYSTVNDIPIKDKQLRNLLTLNPVCHSKYLLGRGLLISGSATLGVAFSSLLVASVSDHPKYGTPAYEVDVIRHGVVGFAGISMMIAGTKMKRKAIRIFNRAKKSTLFFEPATTGLSLVYRF